MSARSSLPSLLESFFRHRMMKQRNASEATIASYCDGLRLLILFAAARTEREPCALTVADLDRDLVLAFLDETSRQSGGTPYRPGTRALPPSGRSSAMLQRTILPRSASRSASSQSH